LSAAPESAVVPAVLRRSAERRAGVSASGSARGDFGHAKNCAHTATARSGVGWQGGNWLLISRVNLFDPERIFRFL